jgi:hypothetical protein
MAELDSQPKSVQSLYTWFSDGKLYVNRRYQRKLVWTLEEKQRLIESILKQYPIPAILLADRAEGGYEIIDGLQRLHTVVSFIEAAFPTLDGRYFDVEKFPTAHQRAQSGLFKINEEVERISAKEVTTFLDYSVAVSVMRGSTETDIDDVFGRINTYGHRLSDQERRQAGVQGGFSELVRELACLMRGDASTDILDLSLMPSISIDLPKTKHGYEVRADEVFWVSEGILRSTDLRDSMDEQCLSDIAACIVGGKLIERSKEALDNVYGGDSGEYERIDTALEVYGRDVLRDEIEFCIDEVRKVTASGKSPTKLKGLLFSKPTSNAFPAIFTTIVIAFHQVLIGQSKKIANYEGVKAALSKLDTRIDTGRGSTTVAERQKNVDAVKGLLQDHLADSDLEHVYSNHSVAEIDAMIRRSEIEIPEYELKQGLLTLAPGRIVNEDVLTKVVKTICAIANNGAGRGGSIIVGVTNKVADADLISKIDAVSPRKVGSRKIVGVKREANLLGETTEQYFARWKNAIKNSDLSSPLKEDVLSSISYHEYFGFGLIMIGVPGQKAVSYLGNDLYTRSGDDTILASDGKAIAAILQRFP